MEQQLAAQIQINKEPPEAAELVSLDNLTNRILRRKDISDCEKASFRNSQNEDASGPPIKKPKAIEDPVFQGLISHRRLPSRRTVMRPSRYQSGSGVLKT